MGSNEALPPIAGANNDHEITVLITGFGPFKTQYPINPSWEIAKSLPPLLSLHSLFPNPNSSTATAPAASSAPRLPQIRLLVHPNPVRVAYAAVRELVSGLWDGERGKRIDFCVHVGMAGEKACYAVEKRGHRGVYNMRDVDGAVLGDESKRKGGEEWIWKGCPEELVTDVDVEDVWTRWNDALPDINLRVSEDAGHYLCDFIYYSSLAQLWKESQNRRVVFLHVPAHSDEASILRGREVLIELIRAVVLSRGLERINADRKKRFGEHERRLEEIENENARGY